MRGKSRRGQIVLTETLVLATVYYNLKVTIYRKHFLSLGNVLCTDGMGWGDGTGRDGTEG